MTITKSHNVRDLYILLLDLMLFTLYKMYYKEFHVSISLDNYFYRMFYKVHYS